MPELLPPLPFRDVSEIAETANRTHLKTEEKTERLL